MSLLQSRKCCSFSSYKSGTIFLAVLNFVGSMIGATWAIILITTLPHQVKKFKGLGKINGLDSADHETESHAFEIAIWTIIILYLMVFVGNIVLSFSVLHGVRVGSPSFLTPWLWWTSVSFLILVINFLVKTFTLKFSLPDLVICLTCMVVNLYLGLGVFSFRKQLLDTMSLDTEIK